MKTKAQVLIISLWILAILAVLSVSIGHRVSMSLRLSRNHKERLQALYLAKAGINIAIGEIGKDDASYDSLKDSWVENHEKFDKILFDDVKNEFATVTQIVDEERKININTAARELLVELLNYTGIVNPDELANNICAWRGDSGITIPDYQPLGYENKGGQFSNIEELMLVKGFTEDDFNSIKDMITIYPLAGEARININTASRSILEILMNTYAKKLLERGVPIQDSTGLLESIIEFRNKGGIFSDVNIESAMERLSDEQKNILNDSVDGLKNKITVKSNYFRIIAQGQIRASKPQRKIECVFDRSTKKIVFWQEN